MIPYCCPEHQCSLTMKSKTGAEPVLICPEGCRYPFHNGIPRFVLPENYADSFGLQWNTFRQTQLDSVTGFPITRDRTRRLLGGAMDVRGLNVLEAGCGSGRFTEILLDEGAIVHAVDLSSAVEANHANCSGRGNHLVAQASILRLPFAEGSFDLVFCVGVVQHTPNPEETIAALCRQVRPGGRVVLDHYTYGYAVTPSRKCIRDQLLQMPPEFRLSFCKMLVDTLWPVHTLLWQNMQDRQFSALRADFLKQSPVIDYHDSYSQLPPDILYQWALLDTHDTLTDVYKHLRSAEEIAAALASCGMTDIETVYAGNGVEARARRPG